MYTHLADTSRRYTSSLTMALTTVEKKKENLANDDVETAVVRSSFRTVARTILRPGEFSGLLLCRCEYCSRIRVVVCFQLAILLDRCIYCMQNERNPRDFVQYRAGKPDANRGECTMVACRNWWFFLMKFCYKSVFFIYVLFFFCLFIRVKRVVIICMKITLCFHARSISLFKNHFKRTIQIIFIGFALSIFCL